MIIEKHNTIFFHVPKTAGYSIEQFLLPGMRDSRLFYKDLLFGLHEGIYTQHLTYNETIKYIPESSLKSFFKFAFFRNPWDRFSSAYCYLEPHYKKTYQTFDNFVEKTCEKVHTYSNTKGWHFAKQTDWIYDKNKNIILDFVGRYENLNSDFEKVCKLIGIKFEPLKKLNTSKNSERHYSHMYTDKTKQLIADAYKEEINMFGYNF